MHLVMSGLRGLSRLAAVHGRGQALPDLPVREIMLSPCIGHGKDHYRALFGVAHRIWRLASFVALAHICGARHQIWRLLDMRGEIGQFRMGSMATAGGYRRDMAPAGGRHLRGRRRVGPDPKRLADTAKLMRLVAAALLPGGLAWVGTVPGTV